MPALTRAQHHWPAAPLSPDTDSCNAHTKLLLDDGSSCSLDDVMDVDFADMEEGMQHALVAELHQAVSTGALPAITREEVRLSRRCLPA